MHTVELLAEAVKLAEQAGYKIREEWLGGSGGGGCEIQGQKWLFLDLGSDPSDQLDQVLETLRRETDVLMLPMPEEVRVMLSPRKRAA
jgi:hypothetical protein